MYKVLDVSRHIINYCNKKGFGISNLKLQKLLYFVQAIFLISKSGQPCFEEQIEAWDFGPVVPEAYHAFKQYGNTDIPEITGYFVFDFTDKYKLKRIEYVDDVISEHDKKNIDKVIDVLAGFSATDLVAITHKQAPWIESYSQGKGTIITHDQIRSFFNATK